MGLTDSTHNPCLYVVPLTPGGNPIYIGVYVYDFVYFREYDEVEEQFRTSLS